EQIFRLKKWDYPPRASQRPGAIAQYTNDIVYDRLAPGVLQQLKKINPSDGHGNRKQKHHQLLTEKVGEPKLREHLSAVVALMKASSSWEGFNRLLSKALPSKNTNLELFEEEEPE
ncbi:MAG: P63C domain-containing protein, partial [Nitrospinota bacterium]|nr:P63C domain-containing protein [Nitrospinota bacterium]